MVRVSLRPLRVGVFGFALSLAGAPQIGRWFYLASALVGGFPIFKLAAVNVFPRFDLTAGVMVSIAMIAAIIIGEYSAAALVAFMMLVGEMLENFTMARADNALKELASLTPESVTLLRDGREVASPNRGACASGDVVLVRPGGRIPVDGQVVNGHAAVDQAAITGESLPLDKRPGRQCLCRHPLLRRRAGGASDQVGEETTLGEHDPAGAGGAGHPGAGAACREQVRPIPDPDRLSMAVVTYLAHRRDRPLDHGADRHLSRVRWCWRPRPRWWRPSATPPAAACSSRTARPWSRWAASTSWRLTRRAR